MALKNKERPTSVKTLRMLNRPAALGPLTLGLSRRATITVIVLSLFCVVPTMFFTGLLQALRNLALVAVALAFQMYLYHRNPQCWRLIAFARSSRLSQNNPLKKYKNKATYVYNFDHAQKEDLKSKGLCCAVLLGLPDAEIKSLPAIIHKYSKTGR